ncbi:MFS transporter [Glutamicibacter sp.]|uniref:MFS transporter n=1 Tax=Glutamicibacter sp. TaxID=1931995 RepID=UPI002B47301D|nr:MFS transporter [Glutamicibacter sp.]HJX78098.1 MFS transporter [Glutamicibacter sp.]
MTDIKPKRRNEERRVALATAVGTTIEWYDFFIYANSAALVFAHLYFSPLSGTVATLVAFASAGVSFVFRPLGAIWGGYLGDRFGRRAVLVLTLSLMGAATFAIGLLPTYATIGIAAPILLVFLRILQGLSAGGEWGGAALLAVEHAPLGKRGRFGVYPQLGAPAGMVLAIGTIALLSANMSQEAFMSWGWRLPFLFSVLLIIIGILIRRGVEESPVFEELKQKKQQNATPLRVLFKSHRRAVLLGALIFMGNGVGGYLLVGGYITSYATSAVGMNRNLVLAAVVIASVTWLIFTWISGPLSDRIGRKKTYYLGFTAQIIVAFPLFALINTGSIPLLIVAVILLSLGQGMTYGPQSALFCEMFPAHVRYAGASIAYGLGALIGGAFSPTIATLLQSLTGTTTLISVYLIAVSIVSIIAVSRLKERSREPLEPSSIENELRELAHRTHNPGQTSSH